MSQDAYQDRQQLSTQSNVLLSQLHPDSHKTARQLITPCLVLSGKTRIESEFLALPRLFWVAIALSLGWSLRLFQK